MVASWLFFAPLSWSLILVRGRTLVKSKRVILTQLHAASMFLAVVCWGLALGSIFMHKQKLEKEHFQSPHSMVGASVFLLIVLSYVSAFYNVVDLKTKEKVGT
jgi:drug/metabolite transporter (DMT)-like permease